METEPKTRVHLPAGPALRPESHISYSVLFQWNGRMRPFLAVLRSFFHSSLLCTFSCYTSPPTIIPCTLTSSCHLFLGLPINLVVPKFISSPSSSLFLPFCHGFEPLFDSFRSDGSRSLFKCLPWILLPDGEYCFITLDYPLPCILFTCCIQFYLYSSNMSKFVLFLIQLEIVYLFFNLSECILLFFSCISSLLLLLQYV